MHLAVINQAQICDQGQSKLDKAAIARLRTCFQLSMGIVIFVGHELTVELLGRGIDLLQAWPELIFFVGALEILSAVSSAGTFHCSGDLERVLLDKSALLGSSGPTKHQEYSIQHIDFLGFRFYDAILPADLINLAICRDLRLLGSEFCTDPFCHRTYFLENGG